MFYQAYSKTAVFDGTTIPELIENAAKSCFEDGRRNADEVTEVIFNDN